MNAVRRLRGMFLKYESTKVVALNKCTEASGGTRGIDPWHDIENEAWVIECLDEADGRDCMEDFAKYALLFCQCWVLLITSHLTSLRNSPSWFTSILTTTPVRYSSKKRLGYDSKSRNSFWWWLIHDLWLDINGWAWLFCPTRLRIKAPESSACHRVHQHHQDYQRMGEMKSQHLTPSSSIQHHILPSSKQTACSQSLIQSTKSCEDPIMLCQTSHGLKIGQHIQQARMSTLKQDTIGIPISIHIQPTSLPPSTNRINRQCLE